MTSPQHAQSQRQCVGSCRVFTYAHRREHISRLPLGSTTQDPALHQPTGCPYSGCSSCNPPNGWTLEDIWYVSWGAPPAYPLPEIYRTDGVNADQWYRVALYGVNTHSQLMHFRGSLTQWNACEENRRWDPNACIIFGNIRTDNRPEDGYLQLYNALNADPRTAQVMPWSSDISWEK